MEHSFKQIDKSKEMSLYNHMTNLLGWLGTRLAQNTSNYLKIDLSTLDIDV